MSLVSPINVLSARPLADVPTEERYGSSMTTATMAVTVHHDSCEEVREVVAGIDTHAN